MPRSGTTWLGKIFDSHPVTVYRHEPDSWRRLDSIPLFPDPVSADRYSTDVRVVRSRVSRRSAPTVSAASDRCSPRVTRRGCGVTLFSGRSLLHKALDRVGLQSGPPLPPQPSPGSPYRLVWKSIESLGRTGVILAAIARGEVRPDRAPSVRLRGVRAARRVREAVRSQPGRHPTSTCTEWPVRPRRRGRTVSRRARCARWSPPKGWHGAG